MEVVTVPTEKCGTFTVYIQGVKPKNAPVIVTIPDLGCNHEYYTNFVNAQLRDRFCWCHIELPGQSFESSDWTANLVDTTEQDEAGLGKTSKSPYPTMQGLAEGVGKVLENLEINQAVLFGEGSGANLLARVAIMFDSRVLGALLIHGRCSQSGPLKLLRAKMRNWKSNILEQATERYLLEHRFSTFTETDLIEPLKSVFLQYKDNLHNKVNTKNLNLLTYSYAHRKSLAETIHNLKCPVLLVTGTKSDHRAGTRHMYETMNKMNKTIGHTRTNVELIEMEDSLSPLVDRADKLAETTLYFLQGLGIVTSNKPVSRPISAGATPERCSVSVSLEKRSCAEFINLDAPTDNVAKSAEVSRKHSNVSGDSPVRLPARYFSRQLSMAELDLPRGPGALSTNRNLQPSCCPRNPSMDSDRRSSVGQTHH